MKKYIVMIVAALSIGIAGCDPDVEAERDKRVAVLAAKSLTFFKDQETGLCFAATWVGHGQGGPGMASVPCDKVKNSKRFVEQ